MHFILNPFLHIRIRLVLINHLLISKLNKVMIGFTILIINLLSAWQKKIIVRLAFYYRSNVRLDFEN